MAFLAAMNPKHLMMVVVAILALIVLIVAFIYFIFNPTSFLLLMVAVIAGIGLYGFLKYRESMKHRRRR